MDTSTLAVARMCLDAAESDAMSFPGIVATLQAEGFESYAVDLRRATVTYYLPDGDSAVLEAHGAGISVAAAFDAGKVREAVADAQRQAPGYTYRGFCARIAAAGCAGYVVSFPGRRAVYLGRTAETHEELFPA